MGCAHYKQDIAGIITTSNLIVMEYKCNLDYDYQ